METLQRQPKRMPFKSPIRKLKELSLGRKAKELFTYLPLAHVSGELDRIIIRSDSGVYNKFLIYSAAKSELTYDMIRGRGKPTKREIEILPNILKMGTKRAFIKALSSEVDVVFLT